MQQEAVEVGTLSDSSGRTEQHKQALLIGNRITAQEAMAKFTIEKVRQAPWRFGSNQSSSTTGMRLLPGRLGGCT